MGDLIAENKAKLAKYRDEFERVFGVQLYTFFDLILGFDIILFDTRFLHTPDGKSTENVLRERYSERAVELVRELIS